MSRRRRRNIPTEPVEVTIGSLSHDGRGVAEIEGKKLFVHGALPGERVLARFTARMRRFDEADVLEVLESSPHRVTPACAHFGVCGGCALQHMAPAAQLEAKQNTLLQNLERIGKVRPERVLEPLSGPKWHYRRKARLSVRYVFKKERLLVGFRERQGRYVADMSECHVLDERIASQLPHLTALLTGLEGRERIPQIEVACGDDTCALIFRHLDPLSEGDVAALRSFAMETELAILLQPGGPQTIEPLEPAELKLDFSIPDYDITLDFGPSDFIQVNAELNRAMIHHALALLQAGPEDRVLDLFCGLGNFTLPLARQAGHVVGVEGDMALVEKARANARLNDIENIEFHMADLTGEVENSAWLRQAYTRILLDPPRSGALEMLPHLAATSADRIVYVSCHPASLARDAGELVRVHGFSLIAAGVMDMFPHTGHVESIALFERDQ